MAFSKFPRELYKDGEDTLQVNDEDTQAAFVARGWRLHPDAESKFALVDPPPPPTRYLPGQAFLEYPKLLVRGEETHRALDAEDEAAALAQGWFKSAEDEAAAPKPTNGKRK